MDYTSIFEDFTYLDLGSIIITLPSGDIPKESKSLLEICKDDEIVRWLHKFGQIRILSDAQEFITNQMLLIVTHQNLFLTLRFKESGRVFGYINLDTPKKANFNTWMLDYCVESTSRQKGIMYAAIDTILYYLKSKGVCYVTALNEPLNTASERLLQKLNFTKIKERSSNDYLCYMTRLN